MIMIEILIMMMMVIEWGRDDEVNIIIYKDCDIMTMMYNDTNIDVEED